jgi:DNA-binding transcriptional regulator YiaG
MPNIAALLKDEINRLARKEARKQIASVKKASAQYRREIAQLKRAIAKLGQNAARVERTLRKGADAATQAPQSAKTRFVAKGLRSNRERLGLSAAQYARLAGVSQQSIYNWESGATRPSAKQIAILASLRALGKRDVQARLTESGSGRRARRRGNT